MMKNVLSIGIGLWPASYAFTFLSFSKNNKLPKLIIQLLKIGSDFKQVSHYLKVFEQKKIQSARPKYL